MMLGGCNSITGASSTGLSTHHSISSVTGIEYLEMSTAGTSSSLMTTKLQTPDTLQTLDVTQLPRGNDIGIMC